MKCVRFKKGNDVKWTSQAGGHWKHKRGEIVAVIGPGVRPRADLFPGLRPYGRGRPSESYVVNVKGKHYWPHTSLLRKV